MTATTDAIEVVAIQTEPIDVAALLERTSHPACGAAALFLGVVRDHHEGQAVRYLEYEAYDPMAVKVMRAIAEELTARWDARKVGIIHRKGPLQIGEVAVAVAVSTPHRKDAFEACRYGIDEVKVRAPIWKKEFIQGGERWVENCGGCIEAAETRGED